MFLFDMREESVLQLLLLEASRCGVGRFGNDTDPCCFATQLNDIVSDPLNLQALRWFVEALVIS